MGILGGQLTVVEEKFEQPQIRETVWDSEVDEVIGRYWLEPGHHHYGVALSREDLVNELYGRDIAVPVRIVLRDWQIPSSTGPHQDGAVDHCRPGQLWSS